MGRHMCPQKASPLWLTSETPQNSVLSAQTLEILLKCNPRIGSTFTLHIPVGIPLIFLTGVTCAKLHLGVQMHASQALNGWKLQVDYMPVKKGLR
jgi:hypothetical protein